MQLWQPLLLAVCFAGMALLQILKSATECGSTAYWVLALAVLPWYVRFSDVSTSSSQRPATMPVTTNM